MLPSIPSEGSYALWLANCLQGYFEAIGYTFFPEIQTQRRGKKYPFDIHAKVSKGNFVKRFGLQVKRPGISKQGTYWVLDSKQHVQMQKFSWVWYSLPDFFDRSYYKVACFHTLFKNPNFSFAPRIGKSRIGVYFRLGSFVNGIVNCAIGEKLDKSAKWLTSEDIFKTLESINQIHTYLDFTEKKAQMFTSIRTEENPEE